LIIEPRVGEIAIGEALVEIIVAKSVMPPKIILEDVICSKVNSLGVLTVEVSSADTALAEATSLWVTYTETA